MGCIITYNNRTYSEDQFKDYVKENYEEFFSQMPVYENVDGSLTMDSTSDTGVSLKNVTKDGRERTIEKKKAINPGGVFISGAFIAKYIPDYKNYSSEQLFGTYNNDGVLIKKGIVDNKILENLVGYRIPNQGAASNDALQIVGILPEEMGDTIVAYTGITTKTGSDFDIDKMYVMMPYYNAVMVSQTDVQLRSYLYKNFMTTKSKDIETQLNIMFNEAIEEGLNFDFKAYSDAFAGLKKAQSSKDMASAKQYNTELTKMTKELTDELFNNEFASLQSVQQLSKDINVKVSKLVYADKEGTSAADANELIQLYKAVLTSPDLANVVNRPIDYKYVEQAIKSITNKDIDTSEYDLHHLDPFTDVDLMYAFRNGKAGVGQEANFMVDIGRMGELFFDNVSGMAWSNIDSNKSIKLDQQKSKNLSEKDLKDYIEFLGLTNDPEAIADLKSEIVDVDIMSTMVAVLNAFVDIAKDPFITEGNWINTTTNLGNTLLRMGVHPTYVVAFMAQPGMKAYSNKYNNKNKNIDANTYIGLQLLREDFINKKNYEGIALIDTIVLPNRKILTKETGGKISLDKFNFGKYLGRKEQSDLNTKEFQAVVIKNVDYIYNAVIDLDTQTKVIYGLLARTPENSMFGDVIFEELMNEDFEDIDRMDRLTRNLQKADDLLSEQEDYDVDKAEKELKIIMARMEKLYLTENTESQSLLDAMSGYALIHSDVVNHTDVVDNVFYSEILKDKIVNLDKESYVFVKKFASENQHLEQAMNDVLVGMSMFANSKENNKDVVSELSDPEQTPLITWLNQAKSETIDIAFQSKLISLIDRVASLNKMVKENVDLSRLDTDGIKTSPANLIVYNNRKQDLEQLGHTKKSNAFKGFENKFKNTPMEHYYNNYMKILEVLKKNPKLFFELTDRNVNIANTISIIFTGENIKSEELYDKVRNDMYSQMMSDFFDLSAEEVNTLLDKTPAKMKDLAKKYGDKYIILKKLYTKKLTDKSISSLIYRPNDTMTQLEENELIQSWRNLMNSSDPELKQFADDLVKYSFITSGFQYSSKQFYDLIPNEYFEKNDLNKFVKEYEVPNSFIHKFMRMNHDFFNYKINKIKSIDSKHIKTSKGKIKTYISKTPVNNGYIYVSRRIQNQDGSLKTYKDLFSVSDVRQVNEGYEITLYPVESLGFKLDSKAVPYYGEIQEKYWFEESDNFDPDEDYYNRVLANNVNINDNNNTSSIEYISSIKFKEQPSVNQVGTRVNYNENIGTIISIEPTYKTIATKDGLKFISLNEPLTLASDKRANVVDIKGKKYVQVEDSTYYDTTGDTIVTSDTVNFAKGSLVKYNIEKPIQIEEFEKEGRTTASIDAKKIIMKFKNQIVERSSIKDFNKIMWNTELDGMTQEDILDYINKYLENC